MGNTQSEDRISKAKTKHALEHFLGRREADDVIDEWGMTLACNRKHRNESIYRQYIEKGCIAQEATDRVFEVVAPDVLNGRKIRLVRIEDVVTVDSQSNGESPSSPAGTQEVGDSGSQASSVSHPTSPHIDPFPIEKWHCVVEVYCAECCTHPCYRNYCRNIDHTGFFREFISIRNQHIVDVHRESYMPSFWERRHQLQREVEVYVPHDDAVHHTSHFQLPGQTS